MTSSRRGFIAGLLALLPFAKIANAGSGNVATIRLFNGSALPGNGIVSPSITANTVFPAINSAGYLDFKGIPGTTTAVSVLDFAAATPLAAITTTFPLSRKPKVFSFYQTTDAGTGATTTVLVQV
jgi:hypothetical protein